MDEYLVSIFHQWDVQEKARIQAEHERNETEAHRLLSNLYLSVERGTTKLTITVANELRTLLSKAYPRHFDDRVTIAYWMDEFTKLPNWFNV